MPMFGSMMGGYRTPPYAEPSAFPAVDPMASPMPAPLGLETAPPAATGSLAPAPVFQPPKPGMFGKLGLAGDILTGTNTTKTRLDDDFQFAQQQFQQQHPNPVNADGNLIQYDPTSGTVHTLFAKPVAPKVTDFDATLAAAGIQPGTPEWANYHRQKIQSEVDPLHGYPTTDAAGNQGLIFKRPSEMGAAGMPAVQIKGAADYAALAPGTPFIDPNGQHRVKGGGTGGAAPSGTGGFPLYPAGH